MCNREYLISVFAHSIDVKIWRSERLARVTSDFPDGFQLFTVHHSACIILSNIFREICMLLSENTQEEIKTINLLFIW